jgi:heme exporter protein A
VSESALEADGLVRKYGERAALDGLSFSLPEGQTLGLFGANGAGKTTLLRVLATLLRPHEGGVRVLGADLPKEAWKVRGQVGYLGHEPLLYRDLTPRENLSLAASLNGIDEPEAEQRIGRLLDAVRMSLRAGDRVAELSAGMRQRIDICRAVLHEPELLLLDEPDAHLDPEARELVAPLIAAGGTRSRVLVSHDREAAAQSADSVLELG